MESRIQETILNELARNGAIDSIQRLEINGQKPDLEMVVNIVKSLASREIVNYTPVRTETLVLTEEGRTILNYGSHEVRVFESIPDDGLAVEELCRRLGDLGRLGQNIAFRNKWIALENGLLKKKAVHIDDITREYVRLVDSSQSIDSEIAKELKRRKLVESHVSTTFRVVAGPRFTSKPQKGVELTSSLIASGDWKEGRFQNYNLDCDGLVPNGGHIHPLTKMRTEFRYIFLEMGFTEMATNEFVESSFWNFDALFQPQYHPARDAHDTFFLKTPEKTNCLPSKLVENVQKVHTIGGFGSIGYQTTWDVEEALKNLLRTHTTATSAKMLYKLAREGFRPTKYFSIDKVFRNETVDSTHLAEFHQVEGMVIDRNLTLGDLIGTLSLFFGRLGMSQLRFKPTYNPYTEPSMEIFGYHSEMKKWIEVGNSGIFRPEMLGSLGFDSDITVIAWGLSLERPTMIKYGISNIRDLLGHQADLGMFRDSPMCVFGPN